MKNSHSNYYFNVHVKKIKIEIHPKIIMIWTYENMVHFRPFKSPYFFWLNFFEQFFCIFLLFVLTYHILSPYNITQI
jgi:hypothetical protein